MRRVADFEAEQTAQGQPTLASVAARVGVSANTVSRAIRAPQTVRAGLREQIRMAMEELNYVPNRLAGGLSGTRSDIVGVVVTSLNYSEFSSIIETLQATLLQRNMQVMLANTRYDATEEVHLIRSILSWRPAAIAIIGIDHPPKVRDLLQSSGVPVVEMWDIVGNGIDTRVGMDHHGIGVAQAEHLTSLGYRRLAFLGSLRDNDARARKRAEGVDDAAAAAGLAQPIRATSPEGGTADLGDRLVTCLMADHPDIDGIVCNSDVTAFGALRGLKRLGIDVPGTVGMIGFGDNEAAACVTPALTTIRPEREAIGRLTAEAIFARLDGAGPSTVTVDWRLIARDSSRRA